MAQSGQKQMTSLFALDGNMDGRNSCKNCVQVNNYSAHKVVSRPNQSLQSFPYSSIEEGESLINSLS